MLQKQSDAFHSDGLFTSTETIRIGKGDTLRSFIPSWCFTHNVFLIINFWQIHSSDGHSLV